MHVTLRTNHSEKHMTQQHDNLFNFNNAPAQSSAVVVRRRRPVKRMELFG